MATYLQFAGRHQNAITTAMSGHKSFGTWNVAGAVYEESTTLTINTPNYGPSDGFPCGSWTNTIANAEDLQLTQMLVVLEQVINN